MAELGEQIGLSLSACHRRVKPLEAAGEISGYTARLDRRKPGLEMQVFFEVKLAPRTRASFDAFDEAVRAMNEVIEWQFPY